MLVEIEVAVLVTEGLECLVGNGHVCKLVRGLSHVIPQAGHLEKHKTGSCWASICSGLKRRLP